MQLDAVPALDHEVVDLSRTVGRLAQHDVQLVAGTAARAVVEHLFVGERVERALARERQDLPQRHGERPHVALRRKLVLHTRRADHRTTDCPAQLYNSDKIRYEMLMLFNGGVA